MAKHKTEYLIYRYSIIKENQLHMYTKPLPIPKGNVVYYSLQLNGSDREFERYGVKYSFIGFHYVNPTFSDRFEKNRFIIGKLAKLRKTETGIRVPGNIIGQKQDDWVGIITVIDTLTQHIFVEKKWKFGNTEQIQKALEAGISKPILEEYNCRVFIKPTTDDHIFWDLVKDSINIYNLELKLISPNILETNKTARESLVLLQKVFKQDEIAITLKNDSGDLEIPLDPIEDYIDYISEGEGTWKITKKGYEGGKRTFSSFDNIKIFEVPESEAPEIDIRIPSDDGELIDIEKQQREREVSLIDFFSNKCREFSE